MFWIVYILIGIFVIAWLMFVVHIYFVHLPMRRARFEKEQHELEDFIHELKHWNEGQGLIVPPSVARKLRKMGIKDGYTVNKPIPKESKR